MAKFLAEKHFNSLRPIDEAGTDILRRIPMGRTVSIEVRLPRNEKFHRLYWALVSLVWDNVDHGRYPTAEDLHAALKIAAGLRTQVVLPDGTVGFIAGSTAFHKMDGAEFSAFFDRICDLVAKHFLPGVSNADLKNEVGQMIGLHPDRDIAADNSNPEPPTSSGADQATAAALTSPTTAKDLDQEAPAGASEAVQDRIDGSTASPIHAENPREADAATDEPTLALTPAMLSIDDRETLQLYADELAGERSEPGLAAVKRKFWAGSSAEASSPIIVAAGAITAAHKARVLGEITIEECTRRCREARR